MNVAELVSVTGLIGVSIRGDEKYIDDILNPVRNDNVGFKGWRPGSNFQMWKLKFQVSSFKFGRIAGESRVIDFSPGRCRCLSLTRLAGPSIGIADVLHELNNIFHLPGESDYEKMSGNISPKQVVLFENDVS